MARLISSGRSFQSDGALIAKAWSPLDFNLDLRISNRDLPEALGLRLGSYGTKQSLMVNNYSVDRGMQIDNSKGLFNHISNFKTGETICNGVRKFNKSDH